LRRYVLLSSTAREARRRSELRFNSTNVDNVPVALNTARTLDFFASRFQNELKYHRTARAKGCDTAPNE
jgi:hypothetical protein